MVTQVSEEASTGTSSGAVDTRGQLCGSTEPAQSLRPRCQHKTEQHSCEEGLSPHGGTVPTWPQAAHGAQLLLGKASPGAHPSCPQHSSTRPLWDRAATGPAHSPHTARSAARLVPRLQVTPPLLHHLGFICFPPLPHLQLSEEFCHFPSHPLSPAWRLTPSQALLTDPGSGSGALGLRQWQTEHHGVSSESGMQNQPRQEPPTHARPGTQEPPRKRAMAGAAPALPARPRGAPGSPCRALPLPPPLPEGLPKNRGLLPPPCGCRCTGPCCPLRPPPPPEPRCPMQPPPPRTGPCARPRRAGPPPAPAIHPLPSYRAPGPARPAPPGPVRSLARRTGLRWPVHPPPSHRALLAPCKGSACRPPRCTGAGLPTPLHLPRLYLPPSPSPGPCPPPFPGAPVPPAPGAPALPRATRARGRHRAPYLPKARPRRSRAARCLPRPCPPLSPLAWRGGRARRARCPSRCRSRSGLGPASAPPHGAPAPADPMEPATPRLPTTPPRCADGRARPPPAVLRPRAAPPKVARCGAPAVMLRAAAHCNAGPGVRWGGCPGPALGRCGVIRDRQGQFAEGRPAPAPGGSGDSSWASPGRLQGYPQAAHGVSVGVSWGSLRRGGALPGPGFSWGVSQAGPL